MNVPSQRSSQRPSQQEESAVPFVIELDDDEEDPLLQLDELSNSLHQTEAEDQQLQLQLQKAQVAHGNARELDGEVEWSPSMDVDQDGSGLDNDAQDVHEEEEEEEDDDDDEEEEEEERSSGTDDDDTENTNPLHVRTTDEEDGDSGGDGVVTGKSRKRKQTDRTPRTERLRSRRRKKKLASFLDEDELTEATKRAREAEKARSDTFAIDSILSSFSEFNELAEEEGDTTDSPEDGRLCLNPRSDGRYPSGEYGTKDAPVLVHEDISKQLKEHQAIGARFLWSHISHDMGCILADFMGLGKTIQVIAVVEAFLNVQQRLEDGTMTAKFRHVLILAPTICVRNWESEVVKWIGKKDARRLGVRTLESSREKKFLERINVVKQWHRKGGLLIMGYELYRLIVLQSKGDEKIPNGNYHLYDDIRQLAEYLCDPGPDLIVLDEGHRIRDQKSKLVRALSYVRTSRRIILTGYPLQNHLEEYWTMVNFARPDYLGTIEEFKNRFVDPIENAQCVDSNEEDLRIARQRAYVLTSELKPLVLRRDQQFLFSQLPPKKEWVLLCKLSQDQAELYRRFLTEGIPTRNSGGLFNTGKIDVLGGYHVALSISNHPDVLYETFLQLQSDASAIKKNSELATISNFSHRLQFAEPYMRNYERGIMEKSGKLMIMMDILIECQTIGDRVVVFSQSIPTLNTIGKVIDTYNRSNRRNKRLTYLRIDGSTLQSERFRQIQMFNDPDEDVDLILISTKAGGEGVNLCGGNRIVIFDVCWNPCNDSQSMCRCYRFGQCKPVFVYRLVSAATMEKKVYDLQIRKEGVAKRIVDEKTIERKFQKADLSNYFKLEDFEKAQRTCVVTSPRETNASSMADLDNSLLSEADSVNEEMRENATEESTEETGSTNVLSAKLQESMQSDSALRRVVDTKSQWLVDVFEQETMFEEDLDEACSAKEQQEAMGNYQYIKAVKRLRKANQVISREDALYVHCAFCRQLNALYPERVTMVAKPPSIECTNCTRATSTAQAKTFEEIQKEQPQGPVPYALQVQPFQHSGAYGNHYPVGVGPPGLTSRVLPPHLVNQAIPLGSRAPTLNAATNPNLANILPPHLRQLYEQQQAMQRIQQQQQQQQQQLQQQVQMRRAQNPDDLKLEDRCMLVLRRGMKNCVELKRQAESFGASIAIEVNSQLTDIVSALSEQETLEWLRLSKVPDDVVLRNEQWLIQEIRKASGEKAEGDDADASDDEESSEQVVDVVALDDEEEDERDYVFGDEDDNDNDNDDDDDQPSQPKPLYQEDEDGALELLDSDSEDDEDEDEDGEHHEQEAHSM